MPPGSRTQRAIPKLVPAKAGTALEAATHCNSKATRICENLEPIQITRPICFSNLFLLVQVRGFQVRGLMRGSIRELTTNPSVRCYRGSNEDSNNCADVLSSSYSIGRLPWVLISCSRFSVGCHSSGIGLKSNTSWNTHIRLINSF